VAQPIHHDLFREHTTAGAGAATWREDLEPAEAWSELMEGGWVASEHHLDGLLRQLVARWVPRPSKSDALGQRELEFASARARGASIKEIAADFGKTSSVICHSLTSVVRKLRLRSEADLVAFLYSEPSAGLSRRPRPPPGLSASRVRFGGPVCVVLTYPAPQWPMPACLSKAERGVVREIIVGGSQEQIAHARGCARRTVDNQVASIHRKLKVHSRYEMLVALRQRPT
jgi:DNA-binding NarL/FixJ family response regulator